MGAGAGAPAGGRGPLAKIRAASVGHWSCEGHGPRAWLWHRHTAGRPATGSGPSAGCGASSARGACVLLGGLPQPSVGQHALPALLGHQHLDQLQHAACTLVVAACGMRPGTRTARQHLRPAHPLVCPCHAPHLLDLPLELNQIVLRGAQLVLQARGGGRGAGAGGGSGAGEHAQLAAAGRWRASQIAGAGRWQSKVGHAPRRAEPRLDCAAARSSLLRVGRVGPL